MQSCCCAVVSDGFVGGRGCLVRQHSSRPAAAAAPTQICNTQTVIFVASLGPFGPAACGKKLWVNVGEGGCWTGGRSNVYCCCIVDSQQAGRFQSTADNVWCRCTRSSRHIAFMSVSTLLCKVQSSQAHHSCCCAAMHCVIAGVPLVQSDPHQPAGHSDAQQCTHGLSGGCHMQQRQQQLRGAAVASTAALSTAAGSAVVCLETPACMTAARRAVLGAFACTVPMPCGKIL